MQDNLQTQPAQSVQPAQPMQPMQPVQPTETPETKCMREKFGFFGLATLIYAIFYAFCMIHNDAGIAFLFFLAATVVYFGLTLFQLKVTFKKRNIFYIISILLLGVSTICTDSWVIIHLNKLAILLLVMCLLLNQYFDTAKWNLLKFTGSICQLMAMSFGQLGRPFVDGITYFKEKGKLNKKVLYALLGVLIAIPILAVATSLLSSADALFWHLTDSLWRGIYLDDILNLTVRVCFLFFASYTLTAYLCKHSIREEVRDLRKGEPVLAITVMSLLSVLYLVFSAIQIWALFLGKMQLPEGYTYAAYAREGFFQLLTVSILNLFLVLICLSFFRSSKVLKVVMTIMSLCTLVMCASSMMRMIIYIRYYYLTILRVFVIWTLVAVFVLFIGVLISIYRESFPLFRYGVVTITLLYLALSFSHPDYIVARVNLANAPGIDGEGWSESEEQDYGENFFSGPFFLGREYDDYFYLEQLNTDAAPAVIPYMKSLNYDLSAYDQLEPVISRYPYSEDEMTVDEQKRFGYYYLQGNKEAIESMSLRTFNVSRYMAGKLIKDCDGRMEK